MIADYYNILGIRRINEALVDACYSNNLNLVQYLLTSTELKQNADIHHAKDKPLQVACREGNLEIVKYLLNSADLKEHADINADNGRPIQLACISSHIYVAKYLLTSSELKTLANIHANEDCAFKAACTYGSINLLHYLIFDFKIEETYQITDYLKINQSSFEQIFKMFELRNLNQALVKDLIPQKAEKKDKRGKV